MRDINSVKLAGRAGKDADVRQLRNGGCVVNISVATTRKWKSDEDWKEKTEWHNLYAFGRVAEEMTNIRKGDRVIVTEGEIETDKYKDKDGNERKITKIKCLSIEFYSLKSNNSSAPTPDQRENNFNKQVRDKIEDENVFDDNDDLPF